MAKQKAQHPSAGLSNVHWERRADIACVDKTIGGHVDRFVETTGLVLPPVRLDIEANCDAMLIDYASIVDEKGVLDFVALWGLPFSSPTVEAILSSAAAIAWMAQLAEYIAEDRDYLTHVMESQFDHSRTKLYISIAPHQDELLAYPNWKGLVITSAPPFNAPFCAADDNLNHVWYEFARWNEHKKLAPVYAVQMYLAEALNKMMVGIQPKVEWILEPETGEYVLTTTMLISNPWLAVVYSLSKKIAGRSSVGTCKRPTCHKLFMRERRDKETCGGTCDTWWRRNHGASRKYTRRKK